MSSRLTRSASKPFLGQVASDAASKAATVVPSTKRPTKRTAPFKASDGAIDTTSMAPPSTPAKRVKKTKTPATPPPPMTPTPSSVHQLSGLSTPGRHILDAVIPTPRPAEPHATNAILATPHGTQHVAYRPDMPPSPSLPRPSATTTDLLSRACAHLISVEPKLAPVIAAHPCPLFAPSALSEPIDPFKSLVSGILAQQVSGAAAASIKRKFVALFPIIAVEAAGSDARGEDLGQFPTPEQVAKADLALLRTAGLSGRKAEYVKGLAEKFVEGELSAQWLTRANWEELRERLIKVRGLGLWSVEMFACFALKMMDVFSTGDLGVQRGMAALSGKDVKKLKAKGGGKWKYLSEKEMLEQSEKFAPYRSLFMWYCWRVEDVNVDAIQNA